MVYSGVTVEHPTDATLQALDWILFTQHFLLIIIGIG